VDAPGQYKVALSSDEKRFGGHDRIDTKGTYFTTPMEWNGRRNWLQVRSWLAQRLITFRFTLPRVQLSSCRYEKFRYESKENTQPNL